MSNTKIHFFTEDQVFNLKDKTRIRKWLQHAVKNEGYQLGDLSYIFCSDDYLLTINRNYLGHETYTDIITFDSSSLPGQLAGDIYISVPRVRENAAKFRVSETNELIRVMIHGVLHLCGYTDKKNPDKVRMRKREDMYIDLYNNHPL